MTTKEAMEELIEQGFSKYKIAQVMGMQPIMVDHYLTESQTSMRKEAADALADRWSIKIDDELINPYQKQMFIDKHNRLDHD